MYMIYHGDHKDMVYNQPQCFDTVSDAVAYAEAEMEEGIPKGHALTLYDCSEKRIWESA